MGEICILIRDFWVIFENYSMRMLSIRRNDVIACRAYAEPISSHAEHTRNEFPRMLSQRSNVNIFTCTIHAEHTRNEFYRTLSILGTNFIACWACAEPISSHAEHARKCLKVEYLSGIEYDFQKSRVTGPWDHKVSVSAKKVKQKISCLCTFKVCFTCHASVTQWLNYECTGELETIFHNLVDYF